MRKLFILAICAICFLISTPAYAVSLGAVLEWKYGACAGTYQVDQNDLSPNPTMAISYWNCVDPQPKDAEITQLFIDYQTAQGTDKTDKATRKQTLATKLGFNASDVQALVEIISDGNLT